MRKNTHFVKGSKGTQKLVMLTAYDFQTAAILDEAGVDILLVGDSLGNVIYGDENTLSVSMDEMVRHTKAVSRATKNALVVGDMPFGSYQTSSANAVRNAIRLLGEGGAQAVKLEGGRTMASTIRKLVDAGIPVMGHVGLTPQSVHQLGGYRMRGKTAGEAEEIAADARAASEAGAFAVVLECVDAKVAEEITRNLPVPTIGIGSGEACDGQVLVCNDLFGLTVSHVPKFVQPVANAKAMFLEGVKAFIDRVRTP